MGYTTEKGYVKTTFDEFKTSLENKFKAIFGTIDLDSDSPAGQMIGISAEKLANESEAGEAIYNAMNPDTATGFSLDGVCQYASVRRLLATSTTVVAELVADNQTLITKDSQATALGVSSIFQLTNDVLVSNESCFAIKLNIADIGAVNFTLTINSLNFTHVKQIADTQQTIVDALVALVNASALAVTASNVDNTLFIKCDVDTAIMQVYVVEGLAIVNVTAKGKFEAVTKGKIPLPAKSLITISTPIGGWISVYNPISGDTGRNIETDDELRLRRTISLKLGGAGTVEAIRARLLNIAGVSAVTIIENTSFVTDGDGRPPKSFECIVLGGENDVVALTIWRSKPAGIKSTGNTSVTVLDSTGTEQVIGFSRPVKLYVYAKVTITKNAFYPENGDALIKEGIAKQINLSNVGEAVIYQSLYQSVYSVDGVLSATIEIGGNTVEILPALASANLAVLASQIAVSDITKITIEVA